MLSGTQGSSVIHGDTRLPQRFWEKASVRANGCWEWTGSTNYEGYGFYRLPGKTVTAHRIVFLSLVGPIPDGLQLDHVCHTNDSMCAGGPTCPHRRCVNPMHLEPVTVRENTLRGLGVGAKAAKRTHCPAGHPYGGDNLHLTPRGYRVCKTCNRERSRARRAEQRLILSGAACVLILVVATGV